MATAWLALATLDAIVRDVGVLMNGTAVRWGQRAHMFELHRWRCILHQAFLACCFHDGADATRGFVRDPCRFV